jgi:3-phenylpropionate/trans-cinnamate dioxygenase ferredoxin reductase subunit
VGGLTTAEALRTEGYDGAITLVGGEAHPPYSRPPLSKQILSGAWTVDRLPLRSAEGLAELGLELLLDTEATGLDRTARLVRTTRGEVPYDAVVLATGASPRRLVPHGSVPGVHVLRSLDDALALRADLGLATRLVVVGGGVLGSEVASVARAGGLDVTIVEGSEQLTFGHLGHRLSARLQRLHADHGVTVRLASPVAGIEGTSRVSGVRLADGSACAADVVVVALGCRPAVDWLEGSGLDLSHGVGCDAGGLAAADVYAVGDVATWLGDDGQAVRAEHQTNAVEQALVVARRIVTGEVARLAPPYFWSEMHGVRIQALGSFPGDVPWHLDESATGAFLATARQERRLVGVLGWDSPREFRAARLQLMTDVQGVDRAAS